MDILTGKERILRILNHEKPDRIGLYEHFWGDTYSEWVNNQGCDPDFNKEFNFDIIENWNINLTARLDFTPEIVKEDEDTYYVLDGNYATLRRHKKHDTTPEHVNFQIDTREKWEELIKPLVEDTSLYKRRVNFESYRSCKKYAEETQKFFACSFLGIFEFTHGVIGHEEMLAAMVYDPEWISDMYMTYARAIVNLLKLLFEREGLPDAIWIYDDLGYKFATFMSPKMYRELVYPAHKYIFDYAKNLNLKVIMHCCGFFEPLIDDLIDAGVDMFQAIEVKAGMDLLRIYEKYGHKLSFMGGIDVRTLFNNDKKEIDAELEKKIPIVKQKYGFVAHSDHSIPKNVNFSTYKYFIEKAISLGTYDIN